MSLLVDIYRSKKKEGAYLYVPKGADLTKLPEVLLKQFGRADYAMELLLSIERALAQADVQKVMNSITDQGFYLQLPPRLDEYMKQIPNDKLAATKPV